MTRRRGGGVAAALLAVMLVASCAPGQVAHVPAATGSPLAAGAPVAPSAPVARQYLVVIDLLSYAAEALTSDPIAGSPDAEELVSIIGDPTSLGSDVTSQDTAELGARTRCAVIERATVETLAAALNARLPADQHIDPNAGSSRSLLHWAAAEGFASLRIVARDGGSPSCAEAGTSF